MDLILISLFVLLIIYHIAEYVIQKIVHPDSTDARSFLITKEYLIAFSCGVIEYLLENIKFHEFKHSATNPMIYVGVISITVGLIIRFTAIIHCGKSFTHQISRVHKKEQKLVTDGIYRYIRHPSYLGFYIFAIGTQVFLSNIFTPIAFAGVLWYFFNDRIKYEEAYLVEFFGMDYIRYRN